MPKYSYKSAEPGTSCEDGYEAYSTLRSGKILCRRLLTAAAPATALVMPEVDMTNPQTAAAVAQYVDTGNEVVADENDPVIAALISGVGGLGLRGGARRKSHRKSHRRSAHRKSHRRSAHRKSHRKAHRKGASRRTRRHA